MRVLTERQRQILHFISERQAQGVSVSIREIADHFGFRSMNAALDHVKALRTKGVLEQAPRLARSLRVSIPDTEKPGIAVRVPVFGTIPAGFAEWKTQDTSESVPVDLSYFGLRQSAKVFGLRVRGDSMVGKGIVPDDIVLLEHGVVPAPGDVVAALIDGESTLKTYVVRRGKLYLQAENPAYPDLVPAQELLVQGVMFGLIRRRR